MGELTPQMEKFCQGVASGMSQADAYRSAYPKSLKWKPETLHPQASKMMADNKIVTRVTELKKSVLERHEVTVDSLMLELEEARMAAMGASNPQSAAAVAATMGKAKLAGLLVDRVGNPDGTPMDMSVKVSFVKP